MTQIVLRIYLLTLLHAGEADPPWFVDPVGRN